LTMHFFFQNIDHLFLPDIWKSSLRVGIVEFSRDSIRNVFCCHVTRTVISLGKSRESAWTISANSSAISLANSWAMTMLASLKLPMTEPACLIQSYGSFFP
jgi:hypothetical protein